MVRGHRTFLRKGTISPFAEALIVALFSGRTPAG